MKRLKQMQAGKLSFFIAALVSPFPPPHPKINAVTKLAQREIRVQDLGLHHVLSPTATYVKSTAKVTLLSHVSRANMLNGFTIYILFRTRHNFKYHWKSQSCIYIFTSHCTCISEESSQRYKFFVFDFDTL